MILDRTESNYFYWFCYTLVLNQKKIHHIVILHSTRMAIIGNSKKKISFFMTLMIISTIESIPIIRILIKTKTLIFDLKIIIYLKVALSLSLSLTHKNRIIPINFFLIESKWEWTQQKNKQKKFIKSLYNDIIFLSFKEDNEQTNKQNKWMIINCEKIWLFLHWQSKWRCSKKKNIFHFKILSHLFFFTENGWHIHERKLNSNDWPFYCIVSLPFHKLQ